MKLVKDILILVVLVSTHFITQTVQGTSQYKPHSSNLFWNNLEIHSEFQEKLILKNKFDQGIPLDMNYFTRLKYQMKLNTTISAKEFVDTNLDKPHQSNFGKVVGELLVGSGASLVLGYAGAMLGCYIGSLWGVIVGYEVGSAFGSTLGVYIIGSSGNETGSFGSTFGWGVLGTCIGIVVVIISDADGLNKTHIIMNSLIQSLGATIGFNLSIKEDDHSNPMVNLVSLKF